MSELVIALEERFNVALEDRAIAEARVLGDLVTMVSEKLAAAGRASRQPTRDRSGAAGGGLASHSVPAELTTGILSRG